MYALNDSIKRCEAKLIEMQREMKKSTIIERYFNTPLSETDLTGISLVRT